MTDIVLIGASCEATGHPTECQAVVSGTVQSTSTHNVTVNGTQIATVASADMHFNSHSHDYSGDPATCGNDQTHDLDPSASGLTSSVTVNGSPMYLIGNGVATDPGSGGAINITNTGSNTSVEEI